MKLMEKVEKLHADGGAFGAVAVAGAGRGRGAGENVVDLGPALHVGGDGLRKAG